MKLINKTWLIGHLLALSAIAATDIDVAIELARWHDAFAGIKQYNWNRVRDRHVRSRRRT